MNVLEGILVVDMTQYLAGPTVTRLLAEQGADVVKIEQPPHGDPARTYAIHKDGRSGYHVQQNRGKRSLCVDFDTAAGREVLDRLLAKADVLVENYGPGVLERRGFGWSELHAKFPNLIMASVSGYGRDSAYKDKPAFDMIAQAMSGIMHMTGAPDGPPMPVGASIGDVGAGVHAAAGIGIALFHRERSGESQHIDISMVDALFHMHEISVQGPALTGMRWQPTRSGHQSKINSPMGVFKSPEGWIAVHVMQGQWARFCEAIGRADLEHDERFADLLGRQKNRHELNDLIADWMATFDTNAEVLDRLDHARIPSAPVLAPYEAVGHPYFESRRAIRHVPDPVLGEVAVPGNPIRLSAQPELDLVAAALGEHNDEVLAELGYEAADIEALSQAGVLVSKDV